MTARTFIGSICMVLIGLGPGVHELAKLPGIIGHYQHHVEMHGESDLGFFDYLVDHFGQRSHDDDDHENLPFHGQHQCLGHSATALPPVTPSATLCPLRAPVLIAWTSGEPPTAPSRSIFQPPRG
jgi:hypothetical protein